MNSEQLTLQVRRQNPETAIIEVWGDVTPAAEQKLSDSFENVSDANAVIFDFSQLDYLNSGGIGLLVTLLVRARRRQQKLAAFGLSSHYRKVFQLTQLDEVMHVVDDEAAARQLAKEG